VCVGFSSGSPHWRDQCARCTRAITRCTPRAHVSTFRSSSRILNIPITGSLFHFPTDHNRDTFASGCGPRRFRLAGATCFSRTHVFPRAGSYIFAVAQKAVFAHVPVRSSPGYHCFELATPARSRARKSRGRGSRSRRF